jgi:hypothetical protein
MPISTIGQNGLTVPLTSNTITSATSTALTLQSAGTTAVTIDTSQNVGIDQTSPTSKFVVGGGAGAGSTNWGHFRGNCGASSPPASDPYGIWFGCNYSNGNNEGNIAYNSYATFASWNGTTYTERMRIDTSGNLLVGTTSAGSGGTTGLLRVSKTSGNGIYSEAATTAAGYRYISNALSDGGTFYHFNITENGTQRGSITSNGSATAYNTSSDYRLKENIAPMTGALAKVAQLKPVIYKWKIDGSDGEGFIAHELAEVKPDCVTGEKDAVDENGDIKPQGIDVSFLVATLTAAIQELKAIVDAQAAEIAELKTRLTP